jgi:hypothetical protein
MPILEYKCCLCGERTTKLFRGASEPPQCCTYPMALQVSAPARTSGNWAGTPDKKWFEEKAEKAPQ